MTTATLPRPATRGGRASARPRTRWTPLEVLERPCARCGHQNAVHTGGAKRGGWANALGWCRYPWCPCPARTDDPSTALPPPPPPTPRPAPAPQPCAHWDDTTNSRCGATPTRLYITGPRCTSHAPATATTDAPATRCAPLRHYCTPDRRCLTWDWQQQPWRILAIGGPNRSDRTRIWSALNQVHTIHPHLTVIHGTDYPPPVNRRRPDQSTDWLVHLWCAARGVPEEPYPRGDIAGLGNVDECLAFPDVARCPARARMGDVSAAGIPVTVVWTPDYTTRRAA